MSAESSITSVVIAELAALRRTQKVSAQQLANRMTELGYPIKRSVIANCESGRRAEISVDHVIFAARALGTDPVSFLVLCGLVTCPACRGEQPKGFTCNTCGDAA